MSYCRYWWDDSDVYVYEGQIGITCCGCKMEEYPHGYDAETPLEMIEHLLKHRALGHTVPEYALESLREEAGLPLEFASKPAIEWAREHLAWAEREGTAGVLMIARMRVSALERKHGGTDA